MKVLLLDKTLKYEPKIAADVTILRFNSDKMTYSKLVRLIATRNDVEQIGLFQSASVNGHLFSLKKEAGDMKSLETFLMDLKSRIPLKRFDFIGASLYQNDGVRANIKDLEAKTGIDLRSAVTFNGVGSSYVKQMDNMDARKEYLHDGVSNLKELLYVVDPSLAPKPAAHAPAPAPAKPAAHAPAPAPAKPAAPAPATNTKSGHGFRLKPGAL